MITTILEFEKQYPNYSFDFSQPLSSQTRIYLIDVLAILPEALITSFEYRSGGRGRPNRNQTRTHSQCATCHQVFRNDYFYTPPSMAKRNVIFSHCKACTQEVNNVRYIQTSVTIRMAYPTVWSYLAPHCACCGFSQHHSALDMHHLDKETKEELISDLIFDFVQSLNHHKAEKLLKEAQKCIPLCSNCHRMLHANAIQLPTNLIRIKYRLEDLLKLFKT